MPNISHPTERPNFAIAAIGGIQVAFSYRTMIGFQFPGEGWAVCENNWGPTTGKHLNYLESDKARRLDQETFVKTYYAKEDEYHKAYILKRLGLPERLWDNRKYG